jgi:vacuolar-type H+-ATPase subunit I/STV1
MADAIGAASTSSTPLTAGQASASASTDGLQQSAGMFSRAEPPKKTSINISMDGRSKLEEEQKKQRADTSDIDNSSLDDTSKSILKKIRELEQKIQDKVQELQQVTADKSLSDKTREQRVQAIHSELASLQGTLTDLTQQLSQSLSDARATTQQREEASGLMHP